MDNIDDKQLIELVKKSSPSLGSVLEKRLGPETKNIASSKLNWLGFALVILGVIVDPIFPTICGDLIPPNVLSKLVFFAGWGVIALRTFAKNIKINLDWKNPFKNETN